MEVEMEYDPFDSRTYITIDGYGQDAISHPFAQVVRFPLQTWLDKRLDWPGMAARLKTLSRGAPIRFHFIGRSVDYADVRDRLERADLNVAMIFTKKYEEKNAGDGRGAEQIARIFGRFPARVGSARDGAIARAAEACGQAMHREDILVMSEEEYDQNRETIAQTCRPLFIAEGVYRRIGRALERDISRDFARPYDSVYIVLENPSKAAEFRPQRELGMRVGPGTDAEADRMRAKYAVMGTSRVQANGAQTLRWLKERIDCERDVILEENAQLKQRLLHDVTMTGGEEEKLRENSAWLRWFDENHRALDALVEVNE